MDLLGSLLFGPARRERLSSSILNGTPQPLSRLTAC